MNQVGALLGTQPPARTGRQPSGNETTETFGNLLTASSAMEQEESVFKRDPDQGGEDSTRPQDGILQLLFSLSSKETSEKAQAESLGPKKEVDKGADGTDESAANVVLAVPPQSEVQILPAQESNPDPVVLHAAVTQDQKAILDKGNRTVNADRTASGQGQARGAAAAFLASGDAASRAGEAASNARLGDGAPVEIPEDAPLQRRGARVSSVSLDNPVGVKVVSDQSIPSPAVTQPGSPTVTSLVAAIGEDQEWQLILDKSVAVKESERPQPNSPVRDLRIQLNPASLGEVTARLRMTGDQLSIEIHADRAEAFKRLSADKDAIVSSLRSLGFQVDDVQIRHQATTAATGGDNAAMSPNDNAANQSRSFDRQPGSQPQGDGQGRASTQAAKDSGREDQAYAGGSAAGDLYI